MKHTAEVEIGEGDDVLGVTMRLSVAEKPGDTSNKELDARGGSGYVHTVGQARQEG